MHLFIILIDPAQEEPPYMVNDQELNLHLSKNTISDKVPFDERLLIRPHHLINDDEIRVSMKLINFFTKEAGE